MAQKTLGPKKVSDQENDEVKNLGLENLMSKTFEVRKIFAPKKNVSQIISESKNFRQKM